MNPKPVFSAADLTAITARMSRHSASAAASGNSAYAPASPIVAMMMRDIGVSREKMNEAYRVAQMTVGSKK